MGPHETKLYNNFKTSKHRNQKTDNVRMHKANFSYGLEYLGYINSIYGVFVIDFSHIVSTLNYIILYSALFL